MKCKACGAEISETNKFCGICGAANVTEKEGINSDLSEAGKEEGDLSATLKEKSERDEIDDILNSYGRKSEESALSAESDGDAKASENAAGEKRENESADREKENEAYSRQNENPQIYNGHTEGNPQINNGQAGVNPQYNRGGNVNMPYGGYPQNPNSFYGPYGGGYPQPPFPPPYPQPYPRDANSDNDGKGKKTKEKRTVSLGIAVLCIILVLFLSAMCGYLTEVCFRNGINPLKPFMAHSIILIDGNQIDGELHNG